MRISSNKHKNKMIILVVALWLTAGLCFGSMMGTAKETVRTDQGMAHTAKGGTSKKKGKSAGKLKYTYCSDNSLYFQNGKYLEQYTLNGRRIKKWNILPKVKPSKWELCYVNNQEILYSRNKDKKKELWSIPITQTKKGDKPKPKKAKKVLAVKKGFRTFDNLYANKRYVAYSYQGSGTEIRYAEYDRKAKKHIAVDKQSDKVYVTLEEMQNSCTWMNYVGTAGVLLGSYYYDANADEFDEVIEGIYFHKLGSGKVTRIGDNYNNEEGLMMASYGKKIFYTGICRTLKDLENEKISDDIYVYDGTKKKARVFISGKRWNQFLRKKDGMKKHYLMGWRIDAGRLYFISEGKGDYSEVFSCSVKSASKLAYEKKLNKFLKNKRFFLHEIIKGKFLCSEPYTDEPGAKFADAIYYKKTGKGRIIKKSERVWNYWLYNAED